MIWDMLEALNNPNDYAVRIEGGEIYIARIDDLHASGATIIDMSERKSCKDIRND